MGKNKPKQSVETDDGEDNSQLLPRTRQRKKFQPAKHDVSSSDDDDDEEEEVLPTSKAKPPPKARKNAAASESPSNSTEAPDTNLTPQLRKRKGGNKRRFTHEYCLTCRHYGRACSGRREGQEGCSVCRDPNREKGEKLRECLWANPEAGIHTYEEARIVHKEAQIERRARDKAKSREQRANAKNQLGLKISVPHGPPPPLTRQLDVVPPPSATTRTPNFYVTTALKHENNDTDTITVDTAPVVHHPSVSYLPSTNGELGPKNNKPTTIKLLIKKSPDQESINTPPVSLPSPAQSVRAVNQLPPASRPLSFVPPPIPRIPPYYDHQIQAWRYPSQPGRYLTPSDIPTASYPAYESAYGHPPAFTSAGSSIVAPSSNGIILTPKAEPMKVRPLDKSGTPCRKWARTGSSIETVSGHSFKMRGWQSDEVDAEKNVTDGTRDDISTSDLSSIIDVDDPNEFEKAVRVAGIQASPETCSPSHSAILNDDPEYVMVNNKNKNNGDETQDDDEEEEDEEEEEEDRLQAQINRMVRENAKRSSTQSSIPSKLNTHTQTQTQTHSNTSSITRTNVKPATKTLPTSISKRTTSSTAVRSRGQTSDDESSNDNDTDDEGPLKRLPPEIRNKLSRTATTHIRISETETITIRPEHFKGESLRARSKSQSVDRDNADRRPRNGGGGGKHRDQAKTKTTFKKRGYNGAGATSDVVVKTEDEDEHEDENEGNESEDVAMADT